MNPANKSKRPASKQKFINVAEAAELLGLSKNAIYQLIYREQIPAYQPKAYKKWLFDADELETWVKGGLKSNNLDLL